MKIDIAIPEGARQTVVEILNTLQGGRVSALHQDAQLPLERDRPAVQRPAQVLRGAVRGAQRVRRRGRGARTPARRARVWHAGGVREGGASDGGAGSGAGREGHDRDAARRPRGVADTYQDIGTSDFLTGLLEKHEKMAWMLRAFLS